MKKATPHYATEVTKCIGAQCTVPLETKVPAFIDGRRESPTRVIAFRSGLLDFTNLQNMKLQPHSAAWFSTSCLPYDFDPEAICPNWIKFLRQTLRDNRKADLLQEWMGLLLVHDTSYQELLMRVGPKRAGKGTILRVIQHIIGPDKVVSPSLSSQGQRA